MLVNISHQAKQWFISMNSDYRNTMFYNRIYILLVKIYHHQYYYIILRYQFEHYFPNTDFYELKISGAYY